MMPNSSDSVFSPSNSKHDILNCGCLPPPVSWTETCSRRYIYVNHMNNSKNTSETGVPFVSTEECMTWRLETRARRARWRRLFEISTNPRTSKRPSGSLLREIKIGGGHCLLSACSKGRLSYDEREGSCNVTRDEPSVRRGQLSLSP